MRSIVLRSSANRNFIQRGNSFGNFHAFQLVTEGRVAIHHAVALKGHFRNVFLASQAKGKFRAFPIEHLANQLGFLAAVTMPVLLQVDEPAFPGLTEPALSRVPALANRSEEHTSELTSLMRISYAVFCLQKNK